MSYRFEKLEVWKDAREFIGLIYGVLLKFPQIERYVLVDQIRRAAISIALNIAEGSDRKSDIEFIRFLRIAISSLNEVVTGLYIALDLRYLEKSDFDLLYEKSNRLSSRINALIRVLSKKQ